MGIFDDKNSMAVALFNYSDLTQKQIDQLMEEDRIELPGCILVIEDFKENFLEYFSQNDISIDLEETFFEDLDVMEEEDFILDEYTQVGEEDDVPF